MHWFFIVTFDQTSHILSKSVTLFTTFKLDILFTGLNEHAAFQDTYSCPSQIKQDIKEPTKSLMESRAALFNTVSPRAIFSLVPEDQ